MCASTWNRYLQIFFTRASKELGNSLPGRRGPPRHPELHPGAHGSPGFWSAVLSAGLAWPGLGPMHPLTLPCSPLGSPLEAPECPVTLDPPQELHLTDCSFTCPGYLCIKGPVTHHMLANLASALGPHVLP